MGKLRYIIAKVADPCVPWGKLTTLRTPGPLTGVCAATGETLTYEPDRHYPIVAVAKDWAAAKAAKLIQFPVERQKVEPVEDIDEDIPGDTSEEATREASPRKTFQSDRPEKCPECHGPRRGRGYAHSETCSLNSRNTVTMTDKESLPTCPECGGKKRGRGFAHTDTCKSSCHAKSKID